MVMGLGAFGGGDATVAVRITGSDELTPTLSKAQANLATFGATSEQTSQKVISSTDRMNRAFTRFGGRAGNIARAFGDSWAIMGVVAFVVGKKIVDNIFKITDEFAKLEEKVEKTSLTFGRETDNMIEKSRALAEQIQKTATERDKFFLEQGERYAPARSTWEKFQEESYRQARINKGVEEMARKMAQEDFAKGINKPLSYYRAQATPIITQKFEAQDLLQAIRTAAFKQIPETKSGIEDENEIRKKAEKEADDRKKEADDAIKEAVRTRERDLADLGLEEYNGRIYPVDVAEQLRRKDLSAKYGLPDMISKDINPEIEKETKKRRDSTDSIYAETSVRNISSKSFDKNNTSLNMSTGILAQGFNPQLTAATGAIGGLITALQSFINALSSLSLKAGATPSSVPSSDSGVRYGSIGGISYSLNNSGQFSTRAGTYTQFSTGFQAKFNQVHDAALLVSPSGEVTRFDPQDQIYAFRNNDSYQKAGFYGREPFGEDWTKQQGGTWQNYMQSLMQLPYIIPSEVFSNMLRANIIGASAKNIMMNAALDYDPIKMAGLEHVWGPAGTYSFPHGNIGKMPQMSGPRLPQLAVNMQKAYVEFLLKYTPYGFGKHGIMGQSGSFSEGDAIHSRPMLWKPPWPQIYKKMIQNGKMPSGWDAYQYQRLAQYFGTSTSALTGGRYNDLTVGGHADPWLHNIMTAGGIKMPSVPSMFTYGTLGDIMLNPLSQNRNLQAGAQIYNVNVEGSVVTMSEIVSLIEKMLSERLRSKISIGT